MTDAEIEAAARALCDATHGEGTYAAYGAGGGVLRSQWREKARAAFAAAEDILRHKPAPAADPLLPRDWLQSEVEKVRDQPPVESWFRPAKALPMPPYEYQPYYTGSASAHVGGKPARQPDLSGMERARELLDRIRNDAADMVDPGTAAGRPWTDVDLKVARRIYDMAGEAAAEIAEAVRKPDLVPGLERAREIVRDIPCDRDERFVQDEAVDAISDEIAKATEAEGGA
jgi:hypothetical protein